MKLGIFDFYKPPVSKCYCCGFIYTIICAEASLVASYRVDVCSCLQSQLKACDGGSLKSSHHLNTKLQRGKFCYLKVCIHFQLIYEDNFQLIYEGNFEEACCTWYKFLKKLHASMHFW